MSITIISKDAKFHAGNVSRIVGPKMFAQTQLVGFYGLLDSLVTLVGYDFRDDKKTLSREDIAELVLMSVAPDVAHKVKVC